MRQWEYTVTRDPDQVPLQASQGWELISVVPAEGAVLHYWRRPFPSLAERVTLEQRELVLRGEAASAGPEPDYSRRILHPDLLALLARTGHTDSLCICDRGFPVPDGPQRLDLALTDDIPTVLDVLAVVQANFKIDRILAAHEMQEASQARLAELQALGIRLELVDHLDLKRLTRGCKGVIRTGDTVPYANIIIVAG